MRVLVVEDDPLYAHVVSKYLDDLGYPHQLCRDGRQAIRILKRDLFDVVLTDIVMPELDGLELSKYLVNPIHGKTIYIIAMSAGTNAMLKGLAMSAAGLYAHALLLKPFSKEELGEQLLLAQMPLETRDIDMNLTKQ